MKYEQRLKVYGLTDLKTRRGDLIQFYKYVNKCDDIRLVEDIKFGQDKNIDGPAGSLRKDSMTFRSQLVKNCKQREIFFH